jgi:hypothetical protein
MIICKDCRYLKGTAICVRPIKMSVPDYVYGHGIRQLCRYAHEERGNTPTRCSWTDNMEVCGPEAKFFESIPFVPDILPEEFIKHPRVYSLASHNKK